MAWLILGFRFAEKGNGLVIASTSLASDHYLLA